MKTSGEGDDRVTDFLGIGFRRCASSWLHAVLSEHPQVGKPKSGLHFFSEDSRFRNGKQWYLEQFKPWHDRDIIGEVSVSYTYPEKYDLASARIKSLFPDIKLVCSVRNPIERAYSDYRRSLHYAEIGGVTFEDAIEQYPEYINRGMYGKILLRYFDLFGDRLKILFFDDLLRDPGKYIRDIYSYLGVDHQFIPSVLESPKGTAHPVKNKQIQGLLIQLERALSKSFRIFGLGFVLDAMKRTGVPDLIKQANRRYDDGIKPETYRRLINVYREDIKLLSSITGRNLSGWTER